MVKARAIRQSSANEIDCFAGFTIVELMVTLVVAAILVAVGVPGFRDYVAQNRLTTITNDFVTAISYARSEAIKRSSRINVTAIAAGDSDNEWGGGWNVEEANGTVIREFGPFSNTVTMNGPDGVSTISFDNRGLLLGVTADFTITVCDNRTGETGRQLTVAPTGRPQLNRDYGGCS